MKTDVCEEKDCPFFGCFSNPYSHPKMQEIGRKAEREAGKKDKSNMNQALVYLIEMVHIMQNIKTTCLACEHFTKQDMKAELFKDEALEILTKGW